MLIRFIVTIVIAEVPVSYKDLIFSFLPYCESVPVIFSILYLFLFTASGLVKKRV